MKMKIKFKKKIVIPIILLLVVGVGALNIAKTVGGTPAPPVVDTYPVVADNLSNHISVTGMVESGNSAEVYNTLTYSVQTVAVAVGDIVEAGDLLCQLDTADLEATIAQNAALLNSAQAKANHNVAVAEKDLETVQFNRDRDYNTQLLEAESRVKTAENTVEKMEDLLRKARQELNDKIEGKLSVEGDVISFDTIINTARQAVTSAEIDLEGARLSLDAAEAAYRAAKMQVEESEVTSEDQITTAKLNADFSDQQIGLQKLRNDLADATITAPVSGVVTAVYAKEGAVGNGLLFVIEDPDDLIVKTKIKEYDIGSVSVGMPVTIKADGTGDQQFDGSLSKIAPTTLKDSSGKTVDTTSAEFEAEVQVDSNSVLRIGMNARMNIITESKDNVMSVPLEAITSNENGEDIIFILDTDEEGNFIARAIQVTAGMETDFACEVSSDQLKDGDEVITSPEGLVDGMQVTKLDQEMINQALLA